MIFSVVGAWLWTLTLVCWGLCYHWNAYEIAIIIISYFKTIFKIRGSGVKSNWV